MERNLENGVDDIRKISNRVKRFYIYVYWYKDKIFCVYILLFVENLEYF